MLHLTSEIQNIPLHLYVYIFGKEIQKIQIQTLRSFHLRRSYLTSELRRYIHRGTSIGGSQISSFTPLSKIPASVKRRPRGFMQQGKCRRGCFNLKHLLFAPHTTPRQPNQRHHSPHTGKKNKINPPSGSPLE